MSKIVGATVWIAHWVDYYENEIVALRTSKESAMECCRKLEYPKSAKDLDWECVEDGDWRAPARSSGYYMVFSMEVGE